MIRSLGRALRESWTYQEILREGEAIGEARGEARGQALGRAEEARDIVLRLGTRRFGPPDRETLVAINAETDTERIGQLIERVLDAASWADVTRDT